MAWTRYFTSGNEDRYTGELDRPGGFGAWAESGPGGTFNDEPYTGNYARNGFDAIGYALPLPAVTQVRFGAKYWLPTPGLGSYTLIGVYTASEPRQGCRWIYNTDELYFAYYEDNTLIDTSSPSITGFSLHEWQTYSMVATASEGGYVSFYHNGDLAYRMQTEAASFHYILFGGYTRIAVTPGRIDDMYCDVATGEEPDECPFSYRFAPVDLVAEGSHSDWQPLNHPDRTTIANGLDRTLAVRDRLHTPDTNQRQTFQISNVRGYDDYEINALIVKAAAYTGVGPTDPTLQTLLTDGTNETLGTAKSLTWGPESVEHRFPLRPDGQPWTRHISDVEVGIRNL